MACVLIADDHLFTREQLKAFLTSRSIDVCGEAVDGKDTLEKVKQLRPALVLLDIYMPHLNGVVVAYEIRRIAPATKIVFFSNYEAPKLVSAVRLLGGDAFISKAEGIAELLATVGRLLSGGTLDEPDSETTLPSAMTSIT